MDKLDYKTVLVVDAGRYVEVAVKLVNHFGRVLYWTPGRQDDFPVAKTQAVGELDGVERVEELWDGIRDSDLIVFPSYGNASLQVYLRESGYRVWGNGRGENLEMDRTAFKRWVEENGLPSIPYEEVKGMEALRDYMQKHQDFYVKLPQILRGDSETKHVINWELGELWWNDTKTLLGPLAEKVVFVVEQKIEGFETGTDRFTIDGQYPKLGMMGHEIKDLGYIGKVVEKYPNTVIESDEHLTNYFKRTQYRNFYATEVRVSPNGESYFIDFCGRVPSPPGGAMLENILNLHEVMYYGAEGILIEPEWEFEYAAELNLESMWAQEHWLPVEFPRKYRRYIKLKNACQVGKTYWLAPHPVKVMQQVSTVGLGDTPEEAIKLAMKVADSIQDGGDGFIYNEGMLEDALDHIEEAKKHGVSW